MRANRGISVLVDVSTLDGQSIAYRSRQLFESDARLSEEPLEHIYQRIDHGKADESRSVGSILSSVIPPLISVTYPAGEKVSQGTVRQMLELRGKDHWKDETWPLLDGYHGPVSHSVSHQADSWHEPTLRIGIPAIVVGSVGGTQLLVERACPERSRSDCGAALDRVLRVRQQFDCVAQPLQPDVHTRCHS
ncbi:hypothetical protein [Curtobacterium sp. PhB137]|uniref:hypothetical protein n=1 Tax=Curtobacterium sp. PhB137 TaxID=2485182 RepID=UPI00160F4ABD|nr:hypothetical protein [Curtobacterium sp. PhB137]